MEGKMKPTKKKKYEYWILHIVRKALASTLTRKENVFIAFATILQLFFPLVYFQYFNSVPILPCAIAIIVVIALAFWMMFDFEAIYTRNYVEYIYFQIVIAFFTAVISLLLMNIVEWRFSDTISNDFTYIYFVVFVFSGIISIVIFDGLIFMIALVIKKIFKIEIVNPHVEKLKTVSDEDARTDYFRKQYEEFFREVHKSNYEANKKFNAEQRKDRERTLRGAENIKNKGFGNEKGDSAQGFYKSTATYVQANLFENTNHFKNINNIDQVKPRYKFLMKLYHPDNPQGNIDLSQEVQMEYAQICKRYNL